MSEETIPSFESALNSLQEIISRLENSEIPLEEALRLYEEGTRLANICADILSAAQLRVNTLPREATSSVQDAD